jgi:hypothetical protein
MKTGGRGHQISFGKSADVDLLYPSLNDHQDLNTREEDLKVEFFQQRRRENGFITFIVEKLENS